MRLFFLSSLSREELPLPLPEAGYPSEMAYFDVLQELKLIVDLNL